MINKRLCVILHLYYEDLWEWFLPYLKNINVDFDLYISLCSDNTSNISEKIKENYPNSVIGYFNNKGMDIAPFLWYFNFIIENNLQYDCVLKLHSKKSLAHSFELGERWRKDLTNSLLKSSDLFLKYLNDCMQTNSKMIASSNWVLQQKLIGYEQKFFSEMINFYEYEFVGGTMFLANFELIKNWFVQEKIYDKFYKEFQDGYIGDGSIAHEFERAFGCIVKLNGFQISKC
jgi:lipopolysaccharide biosynthesis protein